MVSSFVAIFATLALSALASAAPMARLLAGLGVHYLPVLDAILRSGLAVASSLLSWLVSVDDRPVAEDPFILSVRFGRLLAAIGFELFKIAGRSIRSRCCTARLVPLSVLCWV